MSSESVTLRDWYESKFRPTLKLDRKLILVRDRAVAEFEKFTRVGVTGGDQRRVDRSVCSL